MQTLETTLKQRALLFAARHLETCLNADHSDNLGPSIPCGCGATARYVDRRAKMITTVLGDITLQRAYYYCAACGQGFAPRDGALGLDQSGLSPGVARMAAIAGALNSFAEGSMLMHELAGLEVNAKAVERTAKRIGQEVARDEATLVTEQPPLSTVMYAGVDGTGIPMRHEDLAGRAGKQPDGSAKTREVKECVVWTADHLDAAGHPERDKGSESYSAAIESCQWNASQPDETPAFAARVQRELTRRGFFLANLQVFIGDGAHWIWNLAAMIAPQALQIVDLFHAKEHLSELAGVIFGKSTDLADKWAADRHRELESSRLDNVLTAIAQLVDIPGDKGQRAALEHAYFRTNRERMDYASFRSMGLAVGSGIVEAGCRVVVGQRCKHSGMFWSEDGANHLLALRSAILSRRFDAFWSRRRSPVQLAS
jgi:hypothetical protein